MKNRTICTLIIAAAGMGYRVLPAQAVSASVGVQITVKSDDDHKKVTGSTVMTTTDKHTLQITLRGRPMDSESRVAKWYVFGRNLKTHQVSVLGSGDAKVDLSANGVQTFESTQVTSTFTPMHTESSGSGKKKTAKRVDATGVKIIGYGARVFNGDKAVGEFFSDPGLIPNAR